MDKNDKEKQMLYEWGRKNSDNEQFQAVDKNRESYFLQREEGISAGLYIREYGFETLPEFIQELDVLWGDGEVMEQIKKTCAVAAMKNEIVERVFLSDAKELLCKTETKQDREDKLPMYIYNF